MKYLVTIFWSVLISFLVAYVLSSMAGETFNISGVFALAAVFSIAIIILGDGILDEGHE
ncbi:hypothetical protein J416_12192 [Gracilibacillus halophilus YIM-C55.5]|uniref:Uncharacterized protein n=1 Tax=Gracilibacillus halophilus YIM-C55.5 TaxID=1308866 RepID=N4WNV6_9BACI|nr:DUF2929 family protein [Gracilibacillus halophilus]ENH96170.1 hypothetical protein J416_12192 [Gracilibacillus halophilus YIM-C55.5]